MEITVYTSEEAKARAYVEEMRNGVRILVDEPLDTEQISFDNDHEDENENDETAAGTASEQDHLLTDDETNTEAVETATGNSENSMPGFGILGALVSIGAARYVLEDQSGGGP